MKESTKSPSEAVNPDHPASNGNYPTSKYSDADAEAVEKLGITPTLPRSLNQIIGLIGVNSSVVVPWPSFIFVAVLNLANGGTAGLIVDLLIGIVFMVLVYISLAEKIRKYVQFHTELPTSLTVEI
jgi:hypothetical protein